MATRRMQTSGKPPPRRHCTPSLHGRHCDRILGVVLFSTRTVHLPSLHGRHPWGNTSNQTWTSNKRVLGHAVRGLGVTLVIKRGAWARCQRPWGNTSNQTWCLGTLSGALGNTSNQTRCLGTLSGALGNTSNSAWALCRHRARSPWPACRSEAFRTPPPPCS